MTIRQARATTGLVDDLKRISGIGPATEHCLQRAGVRSFAELAKQNPSWLAKLVPNQSMKTITAWVSDAAQLAASLEQIDSLPAVKTRAVPKRSPRTARRVQQGRRNKHRKKVIKSRQGKEVSIGQGVEPLVTPSPSLEEGTPVAAQMAMPSALWLNIREMRLMLSAENEKERLPCMQRMRAQIEFEIAGPAAQTASASRQRFLAQAMACDLITGETTVLATHQQLLRPDVSAYSIIVEFSTPKSSRYQLIGLVMLPEQDVIGVTLGDALTVIPWTGTSSAVGPASLTVGSS